MKRLTYFFFLFLLFFSCKTEKTPVAKTISVPTEWQTIFNGKDLEGWETMGMFKSEIKDNALHLHATDPYNNAWVLTKKNYRNFNLECEFLMADTTANSGVIIRLDKTKEGNPNATAYEANIDWRVTIQNTMGTLESAGRALLVENPKPSEWTKMRIEADGDFLKVFINDKKVVETHNSRAKEGQIGFQVPIAQGYDIAFRNVKIQQLPDNKQLEIALEDEYRNSSKPLELQFKNQSLASWKPIGTATWTFDGDILHGYSGEKSSFLVSEKLYKNFYLKCKFKIIKEDNSGIFIRKHPDSLNFNLKDAIECNIYDHKDASHIFSTGSIVSHGRALFNLISYEDWNEMEIFAKEEHIILTINGKKSSEAYLPASYNKSGNIGLQAGIKVFLDNNPSDIYFKEVMIREMD